MITIKEIISPINFFLKTAKNISENDIDFILNEINISDRY